MKISQEYYDNLMLKLPGVDIAYDVAGSLAEEFLKATYKAMCEKKLVDNVVLKLEVVQDANFASALERTKGDKITEKKEMAKTDPDYIQSKIKTGEAHNVSEFLKNCIRLFENAHVFYRAMFKGKFGD